MGCGGIGVQSRHNDCCRHTSQVSSRRTRARERETEPHQRARREQQAAGGRGAERRGTSLESGGPAFLARCNSGWKSLTQSLSSTSGPTSEDTMARSVLTLTALDGNGATCSICGEGIGDKGSGGCSLRGQRAREKRELERASVGEPQVTTPPWNVGVAHRDPG